MTDPLRDAEEVIGRITKGGTYDRRYRYPMPEPEPPERMQLVAEILVGTIVILALLVGVLLWVAIGTVAS